MVLKFNSSSSCAAGLFILTVTSAALPHSHPGQFGIGYGRNLDLFVGLYSLQAVVYGVAVFTLLQEVGDDTPFWFVLLIAGILRLVVLLEPPFLSNDLYRYIWDGWVQLAGINPYRYLPVDPHLSTLRDTVIYPNINRATYAHTIYPPAAEIVFLIIASFSKMVYMPSVFGMKLAMVGLEAIGIWAMTSLLDLAKLPRQRIIIYAWNPLPIWEFAGNGHVDAITICFISLTLLAVVKHKTSIGALLFSVAILTKFLPVVLLPAIWRRWDWRFPVILSVSIVLLYFPYISVGLGVFGFLGGYSAQEGIDSGRGLFILDALSQIGQIPYWATYAYFSLLIIIFGAVAFYFIFLRDVPADSTIVTRVIAYRMFVLASIVMVGLSPHYPWYYAWLLIPACLIERPAAVVYVATASCLLYLNPTHTKLFWPAAVFIPFLIINVWQIMHDRDRPKGAFV